LKRPSIVIKDKTQGLPYSKGLMAASLSVSGIPVAKAFTLAAEIEESLLELDRFEVTTDELRRIAAEALESVDRTYATSYLNWQEVEDLNIPLVILLGGATGVGKSTVATQLAARLGITRVISTDAIREVLRAAVSRDLLPMLHVSSFNADTVLEVPLSEGIDSVIMGFQEQVQLVSVGVKALIARAIEEGTDIIVEGAHLVPGFLQGWEEEFKEAVVVPIVMSVSAEELHRSHFEIRAGEVRNRPRHKYLSSFDKIRRIQGYINSLAKERDVPVVEVFDLDSTLQEITSFVITSALERAQARGVLEEKPQAEGPEDLQQTKKLSRMKSWEVLGRRQKK